MGVVYSRVIRQLQRFNVENRAMKAIERTTPVSAPKHPTSEKFFDDIVNATPMVGEQLTKKDIQLDDLLKNVFVTSTGMTQEVKRDRSSLPTNRNSQDDHEMGFWEPSEVPEGFCTLRQALQFMCDHQADPDSWTAEAIAKKYKLDPIVVAHVLEYNKPFHVHLPTKKDAPSIFSLRGTKNNVMKSLPNLKEDRNELSKDKNG